jgi:hypothetical protein
MGQCPLSLYANVTFDLYAFRLVVEGRNYYQRPHGKAAQHTHDNDEASMDISSRPADTVLYVIYSQSSWYYYLLAPFFD